MDAHARGDRLAASVLRQAGHDVGRALAAGANLLGPTMVVLGGYAPGLGEVFVEEVHRVLEAFVVPPIWERMRVGVGVLGIHAAALGRRLGRPRSAGGDGGARAGARAPPAPRRAAAR